MPRKYCVLLTVAIGLSSLLLCGCAIYAWCFDWKTVSDSRQYPKQPSFSIIPSGFTVKEPLIDYSAIYYEYTPPYRLPEEFGYGDQLVGESYNFMRLWPTGHVYMRVLNHLPECSEAETFCTAYMGFYELLGTNITTELYVPNYGYIKSFGYITEDEISFYEMERRDGKKRWRYSKQQNYVKYHIGELKRQPDWSPTGMIRKVEHLDGGIVK